MTTERLTHHGQHGRDCTICTTQNDAMIAGMRGERLEPYCKALLGRKVSILRTGEVGTIGYIYYNGYALIDIDGKEITGGMFNNSSTYKWSDFAVL